MNTARIDNRIYTEGEDPFVVLPASKPQKQASPPRRGPPPPPARRPSLPKPAGQRPFGSLGPKPRPKNPRLGAGPLPMTSQPVIGLPQVRLSKRNFIVYMQINCSCLMSDKTSQELRMLSRSLSDCKVTVSNSQLVKKSLLIEI